MPGSLLGNAVPRVEDPRFLTGRGDYIDNLEIDGVLHLVLVRSPFAHAAIRSIDTSEAAAMPGVVAVYTASDLDLPGEHGFIPLNEAVARPPLAEGKVCFVGDPVVAIVAEAHAAAADAAEVVLIDYEPLPVAIDPEEALDPDAPLQLESLGTNLAGSASGGNSADPLADADVVVRGRFENQRVAAVPMEGGAIVAIPGDDGNGHQFTIYVGTQMPHVFHRLQAAGRGIDPETLRVVAPDVGGGFGAKIVNVEHSVAIASAQRLGRPVKWVETRSENMIGMPHGRGQVQYIEMGFTRDGTIVGLRCRIVGDSGAYAGFGGALSGGPTRWMAQGVYRIPKVSYHSAVALTNTTPMGAFRGAGRPEAAAFLERIMDLAAGELEIDPVELRRKNFLRPDEFPYATVMGMTYDTGDYDLPLREALRIAGYDDLRTEQETRRRRGDPRLLGIGLGVYVEITAPGGGGEFGEVEVHTDGTATVRVGTSAHGQGHETSFAMIVADALGLPLESIRFVQSDTAEVPTGGGTGGSRSLQLGGSAISGAADTVVTRARELAADRLEVAVDDVVVTGDGRLAVAGAPGTGIGWAELADAASAAGEPLRAAFDFKAGGATFPFGAHIAVVEVDTETGAVELLRHVAVDDCGQIVNPLIVAGQQHGGIAQGVAQALYEHFVYDDEGNPVTATLMNYTMPSAAELPSFEVSNTVTPTPMNPLGAKGIGESATIGSTPAVQNAVVDALSHLGVRHIDLPCTPERVWRAIQGARAGDLAPVWREPPAIFDSLPAVSSGLEESEDEIAL